jgi:hypothetical protein
MKSSITASHQVVAGHRTPVHLDASRGERASAIERLEREKAPNRRLRRLLAKLKRERVIS